MASWAVDHIDDIGELDADGECPIRPVRHHFGITAFGVNAWTAKAAGDRVINEHEEESGNEELYIVTRGRAVFELDGERREAPDGTLVFVPPGVKRTAFAEEAGTTIVSVGATKGKPYTPVGWELWYPLRKSTRPATTSRWRRNSVRSLPRLRSTGCCSSTLRVWRALPVSRQRRSSICERRSSCPSSSASTRNRIRISMRFATIPPSRSSW